MTLIGFTGTTTALARRMRVVRNDELRAVLHHQQHSIALLHAAVLLQVARELLGSAVLEPREGQRALEKNQMNGLSG